MNKLLLIDDDLGIIKSHSYELRNNFIVETSRSVEDAIEKLVDNRYAVAVIDMAYPEDKKGGLRILKHIREKKILTKAIVYTAYGELLNAKHAIDFKVFSYLEKAGTLDDELIKISVKAEKEFKKEQTELKRNEGIKNEFLRQYPVYHSAHTFEKCYNIPLRNLCYRLRSFIHPDNRPALQLTRVIENFIDLWGNQFAAETYDLPTKSKKGWIEGFKWMEFKEDIYYFTQHIFIITINDLYDHDPQSELPEEITPIDKVWDGSLEWNRFFNLEFGGDSDDILILGVRPFFRSILINMLQNAIEAVDYSPILEKGLLDGRRRPTITFYTQQNSKETVINISNDGVPIDNKIESYLSKKFSEAEEGNLYLYDDVMQEEIKNKESSDKPTGSGRALIQAAHYLSRIVKNVNGDNLEKKRGKMEVSVEGNATKFKIILPYGKEIVQNYNELGAFEFQKTEKLVFNWDISEKQEEFHGNFDISGSLLKSHSIHRENIFPNEMLSNQDEILKTNELDNTKNVMVVEDSRTDRQRIRMLLKHTGLSFCFAWNAREKKVPNTTGLCKMLKKYQPSILLLDLALHPKEETVLKEMIFSEKIGEHSITSAFELIEVLSEKKANDKNKYINCLQELIVITQFIPPVAYGLTAYLENLFAECSFRFTIIHKWREEMKLLKIIGRYI